MTTRLNALVLAGIATATVSVWAAQPPAVTSGPEVIAQREQQRVKFLTSRDYDSLAKMTSPTLSYSHSAGAIDTKDTWIASLRSGQVVFSRLDQRDVAIRFLGPDVAVLNALADAEFAVGGQAQRATLRLTIVYVRKDGEWLFEAWHSSRRPD